MTMTVSWKRQLRENGFIEVGGFRIELTLDNTFMDIDYIPRIAVFWEENGRWHVLRNSIPKGRTLEEGWDNAVKLLEKIVAGEEKPMFDDPSVERAFVETLRVLISDDFKIP